MLRRLVCRVIGHRKLYFFRPWEDGDNVLTTDRCIGWRCDRCGVESS